MFPCIGRIRNHTFCTFQRQFPSAAAKLFALALSVSRRLCLDEAKTILSIRNPDGVCSLVRW
jgi:hypothetical protein